MPNLEAIITLCRNISKTSERVEMLATDIKNCAYIDTTTLKLIFVDQLIGQVADMQQLFISLTEIALPDKEETESQE